MTLKEKIIKAIAQHGDTSIPFSLFMEMALYDKDFGYYTSQSKQFGLEGDFYTSSSFGIFSPKPSEISSKNVLILLKKILLNLAPARESLLWIQLFE